MNQCSVRVYPKGYSIRGRQCSKTVTIVRDGKPYCKVHDPEAVRVRNDQANAKFKAEMELRTHELRIQSSARQLLNLCRKFIDDNQIGSGEAVYQSDYILEKAPEFIVEICELIGYYQWPMEAEGEAEDQ